MIPDCTAVILAGGESRRMGQDKANLVLGGLTLLQTVTGVLEPLFPHLLLSVRQCREDVVLSQVCDELGEGGPLAGLGAALERAETTWVFVVACDMPFIKRPVVEFLAAQRGQCQAVVPVVGGQPQPLAAFYERGCRDTVRAILSGDGKHSLRALLAQLDVRYVDEAQLAGLDPQLRSFFDLDTEQDFAVAGRMERE